MIECSFSNLWLGGENLKNDIDISLIPYESNMLNPGFNLDRIIYDLDGQIVMNL